MYTETEGAAECAQPNRATPTHENRHKCSPINTHQFPGLRSAPIQLIHPAARGAMWHPKSSLNNSVPGPGCASHFAQLHHSYLCTFGDPHLGHGTTRTHVASPQHAALSSAPMPTHILPHYNHSLPPNSYKHQKRRNSKPFRAYSTCCCNTQDMPTSKCIISW